MLVRLIAVGIGLVRFRRDSDEPGRGIMDVGEGTIAIPDRSELVTALIDARLDLISFLSRRVRCRATAEDLAQDVFLRLTNSLVIARQPRHLIFRTAANLASNHLRDERRRVAIQHDAWLPLQQVVDDHTPERVAIGREALRLLAAELASWPARTREIFILNRYEGLTQREIAERLRISSTAIERHMARAILRLAAWAGEAGRA